MEADLVNPVPRRVAETGGRGDAPWSGDEPMSCVDVRIDYPGWRRFVVTGNGTLDLRVASN